jgi:hypothetical protein
MVEVVVQLIGIVLALVVLWSGFRKLELSRFHPPRPDSVLGPIEWGLAALGNDAACLRTRTPIASNLHDALWGDVRPAVAGRAPALPPCARVPVPGCSQVSQSGLPSCLVGWNPR